MWFRSPAAEIRRAGWGTAEDIVDQLGTLRGGAYRDMQSPGESWPACQAEALSVNEERRGTADPPSPSTWGLGRKHGWRRALHRQLPTDPAGFYLLEPCSPGAVRDSFRTSLEWTFGFQRRARCPQQPGLCPMCNACALIDGGGPLKQAPSLNIACATTPLPALMNYSPWTNSTPTGLLLCSKVGIHSPGTGGTRPESPSFLSKVSPSSVNHWGLLGGTVPAPPGSSTSLFYNGVRSSGPSPYNLKLF